MADRTPDPIDRAYGDAERLLDDPVERSARRDRVLAAVAQDNAANSVPGRKPVARFAARGGWLAAAGIVVVSGLLVTRFPASQGPGAPSPPANASVAKPVPKNQIAAALPPPAPAISQPDFVPATPKAAPASRASDVARKGVEAPGKTAALPEPPPPVALAAPPPAAPPASVAAAAPPAIVVIAPPAAMPAPPPPPPAAPAPAFRTGAAKPMSEAGIDPDVGQLHAAAAAGHTAEVQHLLDRHVPVDAADAKGETALMKSIRADQPETAALLVRLGASLDKKNDAGLNARDLAAQRKDPALNRALGLEP